MKATTDTLPPGAHLVSEDLHRHPVDHGGPATYRLARLARTGEYVLVDLAGSVRRVPRQWAEDIALSGRRIRAMREALGLSQGGLADMLQTNPETISRWENGRARPRQIAHRRELERLMEEGLAGQAGKGTK